MQRTSLFFLLYVAISVIAGPDYFGGAYYKQATLCCTKSCRQTCRNTLIVGTRSGSKFTPDQQQQQKKKDPRRCISYCNAPLEMRICQNFSGVLMGSPPPHPAQ